MRLAEIAERIGGVLLGNGDLEITGVAGIREAGASDLTFLANPRYEQYLRTTRAGAVLVAPGAPPGPAIAVQVANPYLAYVQAIKLICGNGVTPPPPGVHPTAVVAPTARLGREVSVGPHAVLEDGVVVGDRSVISALVYVGREARVGADCVLHPHVALHHRCELGDRVILKSGASVGGDGFGYVWDGRDHQKIPHLGKVVIEDDVEIGSHTAIDRGTTGETRIRRGTKLDNLVQVAHNVRVGEQSLVAAQVGISGSTELEDRVTVAGQVGLTGHIRVGEGAFLSARSGVDKNVPQGVCWYGSPARDRARALREQAGLAKLPELLRRIRALEARIRALEGREPGTGS
ncbi:MAG TPA: UDP-3-O-(3-hydroxymyristoyl)glucosamine N-acyltransferase [Candidatus Saccharimonadales bacterium]|nr:UDP-3-O-(3-hydroxymyristoyl)glucosamine N-acyltransferase [Candidatus Saccharimonadales bacterium]